MNKRLDKLHKRKVARARERVKVSEPDVRTPEQIKAAREASRGVTSRLIDPHSNYASTPTGKPAGAVQADPHSEEAGT
jgi:hypothetical protein